MLICIYEEFAFWNEKIYKDKNKDKNIQWDIIAFIHLMHIFFSIQISM